MAGINLALRGRAALLIFLIALIGIPAISYAGPGSVRLTTAQQGIDGTCDFGYGTSTTNAVDTMAKYFDLIGPYGECGAPSNALYASNPNLRILVYISLLDMPPTSPSTWATSGPYWGNRKVGWYRNYLQTTHSWNSDQLEKLYLHFYDNTSFISSGSTQNIPGCFKDSSQITAADSVSRVPNGYASSTSYWSGNPYSGSSRLLPNLTTPEVRDALQQYVSLACTTVTGGSLNFWPGKTNSFQGVFFDNSADIGLGLRAVTGGHIVESYDVSQGPIASNISSMVVSNITSGAFLPVNRTEFDLWWWSDNIKPFLMGLDTLLDTLVTPSGTRARYMLNAGFHDAADHFHDPELGPHDNLLEWGGPNNRGHGNADYDMSGAFPNSLDIQVALDSICEARGNTRQVWVRRFIGSYPGSYTTDAGGGTQSWHEGWMNNYLYFLLLNGDSTYYDLWDNHVGYLGSGNSSAATSDFDSTHFGPQGTFNFRATLNRNFGTKIGERPVQFATGTADGDTYKIWSRAYGGDTQFPNGWLLLFRQRSCGGCEFMSNSTAVPVTLGGSYKTYGSAYAQTTGGQMTNWVDDVSGSTVTTVYLRAGEGVLLYPSQATPNTPPTTPSPTSPTGGATTSTSPTLTTGASTDADNSSLTYTFQVSKFQNFSSIAVSGSVTSSSSSSITWQVSPALEGQTTYWWRVKAADFIESSAWSGALSFVTDVAVNSPPSVPGISSPPSGSNISQTSVTLVVSNSSDVDGNTLTYDFELYNSGGSTLLASQSGVVSGTGTTLWASSFTLTNGIGYSWRARANDGAAFSGWTTLATFSVSVGGGNTVPSLPIALTPANGDTLIGSSITFTWQNSFDPDNDAIGYDVWLMTDSSGGSDLDSARNIPEAGTGTTTSRTFSTSLTSGQRYWWSLRANDGQAWTSRSAATSFDFIDFTLGAGDGEAAVDAPPNGAVVNSTRPTLVATNSSAAGTNLYYFEVATDSFFAATIDVSSAIPEGAGGKTAWTLDNALQVDVTYFWRVKANDDLFSAASSFTVLPIPHASPVPFKPAEHSAVTFHDLPEGSDLVIITLNGETVWRITNVVGGTALWDGTNSSGNGVSSGVYLWFIEGSSMKGKLVVQR